MKQNDLSDDLAGLALQNYESVLENKRFVYDTELKTEVYLSEYAQLRKVSIRRVSVIDLNNDNEPEMILWLDHSKSADYGFLVLHYSENTVYAYSLVYRAFYDLKTDGTFHFSSGASNNGIGRISFSGDEYTIEKIAYCETEYDNQNNSLFEENSYLRYFYKNRSISKREFELYTAEQSNKQNVVWDDYSLKK